MSSIAWVQCDDLKCMKWRKISRSLVNTFKDKKWFCSMNPDKTYATCDAGQEAIKTPKGEKFVFSLLEEGSLVWVKLSGYPRYDNSAH